MIDLIVVGGGPAGLASAVHAARAGLETVVVEPRAAPIDKACGEGLLPGAVAALGTLGVAPPGHPLRGIAYSDGQHRVVADFPGRDGLGVRRTDLHRALHEAACAAGVTFCEARVGSVVQGPGHVTAGGLTARYLIGADGLHSTVREAVGLAGRLPPSSPRWGIRAHFACAPWSEHVEVHWAEAAEAYVTPVAADRVGVAVLGGAGGGFAERLAAFPQLRERLPEETSGAVRGAGPLRRLVDGVVAGRVLLVGDAAGYVDALTGEGLGVAFACAAAAVGRIVEDHPQGYTRDHARITRRSRLLTTGLLWAAGRPALRRAIVPVAAAQPAVFRRAVALLAEASA